MNRYFSLIPNTPFGKIDSPVMFDNFDLLPDYAESNYYKVHARRKTIVNKLSSQNIVSRFNIRLST